MNVDCEEYPGTVAMEVVHVEKNDATSTALPRRIYDKDELCCFCGLTDTDDGMRLFWLVFRTLNNIVL